MPISVISSGSSLFQHDAQEQLQQARQDFTDLAKSLRSGDLSGAQKAFTALTRDMQNTGQAQEREEATPGRLDRDLETLDSALQSGDLGTARHAFAALKRDMEKAGLTGHRRTCLTSGSQPGAADGSGTTNYQFIGTNIDILA
jgi:hypothetical protein